MLKIIFNNSIETNADFKKMKAGVIQLKGENVNNLTGFKAYNANDLLLGDYSAYTTKYNIYTDVDGGIMLSTGDTEPEPVVEPESEVYEPTIEEVKTAKISELSSMCNTLIKAGVTVEIDGVDEHFSYSLVNGDQSNIDDLFNIADKSKMPQPYHCDGGGCKLYSLEQIISLFVAQKMNKTHHTTYFNQLKQLVNSYVSEDDVDIVNAICYGQELEGEYLETYTEIMEHSQLVITAMIGTTEEVINE